jgi:hypothetical protein
MIEEGPMRLNRIVCTVLLWTALAGAAAAQTAPAAAPAPDTLAAAKDLAQLLNGDSMAQMRAAITAQIWGAVEQQIAPRADTATVAEIRGEFERAVSRLSDDIMQDAPAIYARHFSAQELRDLLAFYKSPTGSKALKIMPVVLTDISQQIAPRMQRMQSELHTRIEAIMRQHGYSK